MIIAIAATFIRKYEKELIKFHSEPSAFVIEIAASEPNHPHVFQNLLEAAFNCYEHADYCIVSSPGKTIHPDLKKYFTRITPKPTSVFPHDLYVVHRLALRNNFVVSIATLDDIPEIIKLVSKLVKPERIINCLYLAFIETAKDIKVYTFSYESILLGVAILRPMDIWEYVTRNFKLFDFENLLRTAETNIGIIEYLILCPVFGNFDSAFVQELLKLSDYKYLCYFLKYKDTLFGNLTKSLNCILRKLPKKML